MHPRFAVLWLTRGNISNCNLKRLLAATLSHVLEKLQQGESIVEIGSALSADY